MAFSGGSDLTDQPPLMPSVNSILVTNMGFQATQVQGQNFPLQLTDPTGQLFQITATPQPIVSATLSTDEILHALVSPERILAVTHIVDDADVSNIAGAYPKRIKRLKPSIESILSLEPDLVLTASYNHADTIKLMAATGILLVQFTQFSSIEDIKNNILTLAKLTGTRTKGQQLIETMEREMDYIARWVKERDRPWVLYLSEGGYTVGPGSTLDEMITLAGGVNVMRETDVQQYSKITEEYAMGLMPDIIIQTGENPVIQLVDNPVWRHIPAVKNKRVYDLHGPWLSSASHYQLRGIWALANIFHPKAVDRDIAF